MAFSEKVGGNQRRSVPRSLQSEMREEAGARTLCSAPCSLCPGSVPCSALSPGFPTAPLGSSVSFLYS